MKGNHFLEIEVLFENQHDNVRLCGTLSIPDSENAHPCIILISGSGPQTRDEDVLGHKIFKDIANHLTSNGIAVLRFDDRGVGKSRGVFGKAGLIDFQNDVIAAFDLGPIYLMDLAGLFPLERRDQHANTRPRQRNQGGY